MTIAFLMRPTAQIPPDDLEGIVVPTVLIRGRHDRGNRAKIAQDASGRYGWPLHVIENCADDRPRDQPRAFLDARRVALGTDGADRSPRVRRLL